MQQSELFVFIAYVDKTVNKRNKLKKPIFIYGEVLRNKQTDLLTK